MTTDEDGLKLEGSYPLLISTVQDFPDEYEALAINESNESLLRATLLLNETPDLDDHDPLSAELRRQDIKINFLLDMVGELLAQNNIVPPRQEIRLSASVLQCRLEAGVKPGDKMELALYLNPATPRPLTLFGAVESVGGQDGAVIALNTLSQPVQDLLEKIIFRQHRRLVALRRRETGGQEL